MRAVAVLAVFADHLFGWPTGGFIGVDVFFVLSGFFITGLLIRERASTRRLSFRNFYTRRAKRILPSALLVIAVTVACAYWLFPASRAKDTLVDGLYAALFGANWRFLALGSDYFQSARPPSPVQHYWSLSIEEQFYFVWPLLLAGIFLATRRWRKRGYLRAREWGLLTVMTAVVVMSFGWAMLQSGANPNAAYFSTFTRVWELGVGALLAIVGPWLERTPSAARLPLAYLGLAGIAASLFAIDPATRWPAPWAVLPVLSTALVVAAFHGTPLRGMRVLDNGAMRWFGDTSYTLYLWHWPVIVLLLAVIPKGPLFYCLSIGIAIGLTAVTYHFYENPIRKSDWLSRKPTASSRHIAPGVWAAGGAAMAAVMAFSILWIRAEDRNASIAQEVRDASIAEETRQSTGAPAQAASQNTDRCFGAAAMTTPGCTLYNSTEPLRPSMDLFATDDGGENRCLNPGGPENPPSCEYGYLGEKPAARIAVVGDSHAAATLPALWKISAANRWHLTAYLATPCALMSPPLDKCLGAGAVQDELVAHPYDAVITTNWSYDLADAAAYAKSWNAIAAAGSRIIVIPDNPTTSDDAMACLTRAANGTGKVDDCGTPRAEAFKRHDRLSAGAALVPGATVIDLSNMYCNADRCPSVIGNAIVYRDHKDGMNSHITATYMETLAPAIEAGIKRALS